jgi:hypothetical protein
MEHRIFRYDEASALLEPVRERTLAAHERVQTLRAQLEGVATDSPQAVKLGEWIDTTIQQWAEDILALGALPKGLWTVDFDSGRGYFYCWSLNEARLTHYHRYEDGFAGRKPLSDLSEEGEDGVPLLLN